MATKGIQFDTKTGATGDGVISGGEQSGGHLFLRSTQHATKGRVKVEDGSTLAPESTSAFTLPQTGAGVPSHTAPEGQEYFDTTNNHVYKNTSNGSGTTWTRVGYFSDIPTAYGSDATNVGDPDPGASALFSRGDHVHGIERGATIGTPTYNSAPYFNTDHHLFGVRANGLYRPVHTLVMIDDEFWVETGREGWTSAAIGSGNLVMNGWGALAHHPGYFSLYASASVTNSGWSMRLGPANPGFALAGDEWFAILVRFVSNNADQRFRLGFGDGSGTANDSNAIGFQDNNGAGGALRGYCRASGSQSSTSAFTYSIDTWYWLVCLMRSTSNISFYVLDVDGDVVSSLGNVTSNIPTLSMNPLMRWWRTTTGTAILDVDYFGYGGALTRSFFRKA